MATVYVPQGFDEYMNLVLDDAEEMHLKNNTRKQLGARLAASWRLLAFLALSAPRFRCARFS